MHVGAKDSCQAFCEGDANCVGMEYSASRCEAPVWDLVRQTRE